MNKLLIPILLIIILSFCSCSGSKTNQLWTQVYPDYVAINVRKTSPEFEKIKESRVMNENNWYWSPDGEWLFIKKPMYERCFGYAGKSLATPIAMSWDGVIIIAKTLDGSVSKDAGGFAMGIAQLAQIMAPFTAIK